MHTHRIVMHPLLQMENCGKSNLLIKTILQEAQSFGMDASHSFSAQVRLSKITCAPELPRAIYHYHSCPSTIRNGKCHHPLPLFPFLVFSLPKRKKISRMGRIERRHHSLGKKTVCRTKSFAGGTIPSVSGFRFHQHWFVFDDATVSKSRCTIYFLGFQYCERRRLQRRRLHI